MNKVHTDVVQKDVIVKCLQGKLRGFCEAGVVRFMDIPYADDLPAEERFGLPRPPQLWDDVRDAQGAGAIFPQLPSRLDFVMGPREAGVAQSENAFRLNIWTPSINANLPVLFWIHGGGFMTGGGALNCYHGDELARSGNVIVVTVNYRLGILGNLYKPGVSAGNLSVHDLLAAFNWVYENISSFGGDPFSITVAGQSAGAWYTQLLMAIKGTSEKIKRAMLMSLPNIPPMTKEEALELADSFCALAGVDSSGNALNTLTTNELLNTQTALLRSQKLFADLPAMFMPMVDGIVPADVASAASTLFSGKEVLIGTTREEMSSFFGSRSDLLNASKENVVEYFHQKKGEHGTKGYALYESLRHDNSPYTQLVDFASDGLFRLPTISFVEQLEKSGVTTYLYEFNLSSPQVNVFSGHCFELPFFFHNFDSWKDAPMLAGIDAKNRNVVSQAFYSNLLMFVKMGNPNTGDTTSWPAYDQIHRMTMQFNNVSSAVGDPAKISIKRIASLTK